MKDERIFRVTKQGYRRVTVQYKSRTAISAMFATWYGNNGNRRPDILKVEAIDPDGIPWTDVTDEFRNRPAPKCRYHPAYTGVRKPAFWSWEDKKYVRMYLDSCTCWKLYAEKHPEYPSHDPLCTPKHTDPAQCPCQVLKKIAPPGNEPGA